MLLVKSQQYLYDTRRFYEIKCDTWLSFSIIMLYCSSCLIGVNTTVWPVIIILIWYRQMFSISWCFDQLPLWCLYSGLGPALGNVTSDTNQCDRILGYIGLLPKPFSDTIVYIIMGLLPDTQNCGCACAGNAGHVSHVTTGKRSLHASRHVRDARAVMHAGIANYRFPLKSAAGENVSGIPGACATCNFTYLVRGPCPSMP